MGPHARTSSLLSLAAWLAVAAPSPALEVGDAAPPLSVEEWVKAGPVDLADNAKGKVVVVEFWATWCGPCVQTIPHLTELQQRHAKDGVIVVGMTSGDPNNGIDKVKKFVADWGDRMAYTVAFDRGSSTSEAYMEASGQQGIPTAFVVDRTGKLVWIGHPSMGLDDVLAEVLAGTYDVALSKKVTAAQNKLQMAGQMGDGKGVLGAADELTQLKPSSAQVWLQKLRVLEMLGEGDDAQLAALRSAVAALQAHPDQLIEMVVEGVTALHIVQHHTDVLAVAVAKAREQAPAHARLAVAETLVLSSSGQHDPAREAMSAALAALGSDDEQLGYLAAALTALAAHAAGEGSADSAAAELALRAYDAAIAAAPAEHGHLLGKFYVISAVRHDFASAAQFGQVVIERAAKNPDILNGLAWSLLTDETYEGKLHALALTAALALEKLPESAEWTYLDTIALAQFENGNVARAVELQEKAVAGCENEAARSDLEERLARFKAALGQDAGK